jgi:hypothetical protein
VVQLFDFRSAHFLSSKRHEHLNYVTRCTFDFGTQILDLPLSYSQAIYIISLKCIVYNLSCITRLGVAKQLSSVSGSGATHLY